MASCVMVLLPHREPELLWTRSVDCCCSTKMSNYRSPTQADCLNMGEHKGDATNKGAFIAALRKSRLEE